MPKKDHASTAHRVMPPEPLGNEAHFRAFAETAPVGVYVGDPAGDCVYANRRWLEMAGLTMEQAAGSGWMQGLHPDDRETVGRDWYRFVRGNGEWAFGCRLQDREGRITWVHCTAAPILDDDAHVVGYVGISVDITERKLAEEELERARATSEGIIANLQDGFSILDANGVHLSVNPALCRMTGFAEDELIGVGPPHPYWPPEETETYRATLARTERGESVEVELTFMRKSGERFPVILSPSLLKDAHGDTVVCYATIKDITARKRAEQQLKESESRFRMLLEKANDAIYVHELSEESPGRFLEANKRASEMLGYTREEFLSMDVPSIDVPEMHQRTPGIVRRLLETGRVTFATEHLTKNGERVPVEISTSLFDLHGKPTVLSIVRDITERKQAEALLGASEEKYRSIVEQAHDGIAIIGPDGGFQLANEVFAGMVGYSWDELRALPYLELVPEEAHETIRARVRHRLVGADEPSSYEQEILRKDKTTFLADVHAAAIDYGGGTADLIMLRDVTERKVAEQELKELNESLEKRVQARTRELVAANEELVEANAAKTRFLRSMSHELRTPLNSVIGFSGIMMDGLSGEVNEEQARQLAMINSSGHHLLALINDILDLSRIEAGRVKIILEPIDVPELLGEVMQSVEPAARDKGLELNLEMCDTPCPLTSDRTKVRQILLNLLGNAVKFTESGQVTLTAAPASGDLITFSVMDTGPGIPAEEQERIFGEFTQVLGQPGPPAEGTGLGLAISRALAAALGGMIQLHSTVGEGSTFTLMLPQSPARRGSAGRRLGRVDRRRRTRASSPPVPDHPS